MIDERPSMTLTISQAADELQISRAGAYVLVHKGLLKTVVVGSRRRVIRAELERLLADNALESART